MQLIKDFRNNAAWSNYIRRTKTNAGSNASIQPEINATTRGYINELEMQMTELARQIVELKKRPIDISKATGTKGFEWYRVYLSSGYVCDEELTKYLLMLEFNHECTYVIGDHYNGDVFLDIYCTKDTLNEVMSKTGGKLEESNY